MEQALQTDTVLKTVFECFSFNRLKELRFVCKYWNEIATLELRKRADSFNVVAVGSGLLKGVYNFELSMKNKEITLKLPISARVKRSTKNDWKVLKDVFTHESWRTRVSILQLTCFSASDLNRLIPVMLNQLPSLKILFLEDVDCALKMDKSIIPEGFAIPEVCSTKKFSLTTLHVTFRKITSADSETLYPGFLRQCRSLKEFKASVSFACNETLSFFASLNELQKEDKDFLSSCDSISLQLRPDSVRSREPLNAIMQFINNTQPRLLDFSESSPELDIISAFTMLKTEIRGLALDVWAFEKSSYHSYTHWLLKTLKKFKVLAQLQELYLKPYLPQFLPLPVSEPAPLEREVAHDLSKVTILKVGFPLIEPVKVKKLRRFLEDVGHHLRNVSRLEFFDFDLDEILGLGPLESDLTPLFEGIKRFEGLRHLHFDIDDTDDALNSRGLHIECSWENGVFAPLALLEDPKLETLSINANVDYDFTLDSVLVAFFANYKPKVKVNLNLKTNSLGRVKLQYSKEELEQALVDAVPEFDSVVSDDECSYEDDPDDMDFLSEDDGWTDEYSSSDSSD